MNEKQMQDMAVSILLDEYTQLDVAQLLKEYEEDEENGEVPNVPDTLDERCEEMIRLEFARKRQKKIFVRISKILSRVAMVTLVLIGLCTVSVLSVKAWRMPVLRFVLETFDRRSSVSMEGEIEQETKTPEDVIEKFMKNIPDNYQMVQMYSQNGQYQMMYSSKYGERINLIVSEYRYENYFDTESTRGTRMQINGYDVVFVDKNGYKAICLDGERELMIEVRTVSISEEQFWNIVYELTE